jgi:putative ABC transport system ATP-binding protein
MTTEPVIRTASLGLHFDDGNFEALDGLDLQVREGEFLAITGPSGCGKSSLLNLIGLLDVPTSGEIYFRGQPYASIDDQSLFRRRHIGFVFQSFHLLPTLSVFDNVVVPTISGPWPARNHRAQALSLLERLGLEAKANQFPAKLSGGERQRAAIARALMNHPDIILADEPTGSLDSANADQVLDLLQELRKERGLTVIMVTHDADVSARASRVVRLRDGKLEQTDMSHEPV